MTGANSNYQIKMDIYSMICYTKQSIVCQVQNHGNCVLDISTIPHSVAVICRHKCLVGDLANETCF